MLNIHLALSRLNPNTQRAYLRWIERYLATPHLDEEIILDNQTIDALRLKIWLEQLQAQGMATRSIEQARSAILFLAHEAASNQVIPYERVAAMETVRSPHSDLPQRSGTWLTKDQVKQMLDCLEMRYAHQPARLARDKAMLLLMVICGLRRGELVAARWRDLTIERAQSILLVHGKNAKDRRLKLPEGPAQALEVWRGFHPRPYPDEPMFVRISRSRALLIGIGDLTVWQVVQEAARSADLPAVTPHDLRRTFARGAYESGATPELIRQALGHASMTTTERYIHAVTVTENTAPDLWDEALHEPEETQPLPSIPDDLDETIPDPV